MKNLFLLFILVLVLSACQTQKKAEKQFSRGNFENAIFLSKKLLKKDPDGANFRIAESYRLSNRLKEAGIYYQNAIEAGYSDESAYLYWAQSLKQLNKYDQAQQILEKYINVGKDKNWIARAEKELQGIQYLNQLRKDTSWYKIKNLEVLNTVNAEYAPFYKNGELYFVSNRDGGKTYKATGTTFTDIYKVKTKGAAVNAQTIEALPATVNDPIINEGSVAFSKDGTLMIYAKGNDGKVLGASEVMLYFTRYRNSEWQEPRPLNINDPKAWTSTPALSPDGTTLYFSSNRKGGFGGADLYSAKLDRRGRWVDVKNMGDKVNTSGDEMFPYAAEDGRFYFSSSGHPSFGGLDIFEMRREKGEIKIINIGLPVNSENDDFGLFLFDPIRGFFSSNRPSGKGDDDIYSFINNDPNMKIVNYHLRGITYFRDDQGNENILSNTQVNLFDQTNELLDEAFTTASGSFIFQVFPEENYTLLGTKPDYFGTRISFSTIGKTIRKDTLTELVTDVFFDTKIVLDPIVIDKTIVLENIYYDLDKFEIRPDAAKELDKLVTVLKDNPEISIELSSHTDARADDQYNLTLSQKRAKSAVEYIISKGVESKRLIAKGYGETQLKIQDALTEEQHQVNRRTEFKVTQYKSSSESEITNEEDRFFDDEDQ